MESKAKKKYEFGTPFGIDFVLALDYPDIKRYGIRKGEEDIDCPFCKRKRKAHVSYPNNVFRCNACNTSGSLISLHQKAMNFQKVSDAKKDLFKRWNSLSKEDRENLKESASKARALAAEKTYYPMHVGTRNRVYQNLLSLLDLCDEDKADLLRRGLSEEEIEENGYKSFPKTKLNFLAEESLFMVKKEELTRLAFLDAMAKELPEAPIPGYFTVKGDISLVERKNAGYMIPVKNAYGQIEAFQIRNLLPDNATEQMKNDFRKYTWFTSTEMSTGIGVREVGQIHHVGFNLLKEDKSPETVLLTEGCLKADVASSLMKKLGITKDRAPFIAVMGVNNTSQLKADLEILKGRGTKNIQVCFDMDYKNKEQVEAARIKVKEIIESVGLNASMMNWDPKFKGIDDYLLHLLKEKEAKAQD